VTGLRPTFGRVGRSGAMALSYTMDKIGPMARSADDCGLILQALAGHDPDDKGSLPAAQAEFAYAPHPAFGHPLPARRGEGSHMRIGWLTKAWKDIDPDI